MIGVSFRHSCVPVGHRSVVIERTDELILIERAAYPVNESIAIIRSKQALLGNEINARNWNLVPEEDIRSLLEEEVIRFFIGEDNERISDT